jgi:hypothetical protein
MLNDCLQMGRWDNEANVLRHKDREFSCERVHSMGGWPSVRMHQPRINRQTSVRVREQGDMRIEAE